MLQVLAMHNIDSVETIITRLFPTDLACSNEVKQSLPPIQGEKIPTAFIHNPLTLPHASQK